MENKSHQSDDEASRTKAEILSESDDQIKLYEEMLSRFIDDYKIQIDEDWQNARHQENKASWFLAAHLAIIAVLYSVGHFDQSRFRVIISLELLSIVPILIALWPRKFGMRMPEEFQYKRYVAEHGKFMLEDRLFYLEKIRKSCQEMSERTRQRSNLAAECTQISLVISPLISGFAWLVLLFV